MKNKNVFKKNKYPIWLSSKYHLHSQNNVNMIYQSSKMTVKLPGIEKYVGK